MAVWAVTVGDMTDEYRYGLRWSDESAPVGGTDEEVGEWARREARKLARLDPEAMERLDADDDRALIKLIVEKFGREKFEQLIELELLFAVECAEKNINLNAIGSDNAMALLDATTDRRAWWRRLLDSRWPK
jgi:hypothetical protein